MAESARGRALTICAILFGILALSNFAKPLQLGGEHTGFVLLGKRLTGTPNTIAGPLFGLLLAVYAAGIWRMRRWAVPMGVAYAVYVILNLLLFSVRMPRSEAGGPLFVLVYATLAIGVSSGAVWLLRRRRAALT